MPILSPNEQHYAEATQNTDIKQQPQPSLTAIFSKTTWVCRQQKGRTILDFNEARDDGVAVASAGPYANLCTSLQTDNHASISPLSFANNNNNRFTALCPGLPG